MTTSEIKSILGPLKSKKVMRMATQSFVAQVENIDVTLRETEEIAEFLDIIISPDICTAIDKVAKDMFPVETEDYIYIAIYNIFRMVTGKKPLYKVDVHFTKYDSFVLMLKSITTITAP